MALEYGTFKHGGVTFPLGAGSDLLKDADPALYGLLDFFVAMLDRHIGTRFASVAVAAALKDQAGNVVASPVAGTLPYEPAPFLTGYQLQFPVLAAYRTEDDLSLEKTVQLSTRSTSRMQVDYILPPMDAAQAEAMWPFLKAVVSVLHNRLEQGFDPSYTPPFDGASAGDSIWQYTGIEETKMLRARYGAYQPTDGLFFPSVSIELAITELVGTPTDGFDDMTDVLTHLDLDDPEGTVSDVVETDTDL